MDFASRLAPEFGVARLIVEAILLSLLGIVLLIAFIVIRRWYRGRYFRRLSERTFALRSEWEGILSGSVPARTWRPKPLDCEIVESILLDNIEIASTEQLPVLLACLRSSGLIDMRIYQARHATGWDRRLALIALGRTRAPEAVPALAEGLDAPAVETRIATVRGLGRTALIDAAIPILDHLLTEGVTVPEHALKNALVCCCRDSPQVLLRYLKQSAGSVRELLARVLGELATADLGEDLILLATEDDAEVRASAARALGNAQPSFALPVLSVLVQDKEWFVRLRAVVALAAIDHTARIRPLLRALCDSNRYVRLRAAWALAQMGSKLDRILTEVVDTQDNYALQAFISELERSGEIERLMDAMRVNSEQSLAGDLLFQILLNSREKIEQASKVSAATAGGR